MAQTVKSETVKTNTARRELESSALYPSLKGPPLTHLHFSPQLISVLNHTHKHTFPFSGKKMVLLVQTLSGSFMSKVQILLLKFYLKDD